MGGGGCYEGKHVYTCMQHVSGRTYIRWMNGKGAELRYKGLHRCQAALGNQVIKSNNRAIRVCKTLARMMLSVGDLRW